MSQLEPHRETTRGKTAFQLAQVLLAVAIAALASALFLALSVYDNKYFAPGTQAINGILYLNDAESDNQPVRYLCDGWAFYPDQLLTPDTLSTADTGALRYLSLGQYGNFSMGETQRSPHGTGTYTLTLNLPEETRMYALDIPEVYSAYRLYINGNLAASLGNPDPDNYIDAVGDRMALFEGGGSVTLLFAVSDYSYVYSGMTHPIAFGDPQSIISTHEMRVSIGAAAESMTMLFGILALMLSIAIRNRRLETGLFALLCACTALFTAYPLVRGLFVLPVQPWYTLELVSGYAVVVLVIAICNTICKASRLAAWASTLVAGAFCLAVALFSLGAPFLSEGAITLFSTAAFCFKLMAAAYLLACAVQRIRQTGRFEPMLFASVFYAASVVWDRLIPKYEPILGGWFMEWGCLALVFATGISLASMIASGYRRGLSLAAQRRSMEQQITVQSEHLRQLASWEETERAARHDFRQHLNLISVLAQENKTAELAAYVDRMSAATSTTEQVVVRLCDHVELNALLNHFRSVARDRSIRFTVQVAVPQDVSVSAVDLCIIVGNLLENAFEACMAKMNENEATDQPCCSVFIAAEVVGNELVVVVDNEPANKPRVRDGRLLSSKRDGWGIGFSSVRDTVNSLGGTLSAEYQNEQFSVSLYIPVS